MRPGGFRNGWRFAGCSASALTPATTFPAAASPGGSTVVVGNAPLAVALGAAGFAVLAMLALRKVVRDGKAAREQAGSHIAGLRAQLDEFEALLSAGGEVTVLWPGHRGQPRVFGQIPALLPPGRRPEAILDLPLWLDETAATRLAPAHPALRAPPVACPSLCLLSRRPRLHPHPPPPFSMAKLWPCTRRASMAW